MASEGMTATSEFQGRLETLVLLMQAANELPEMAETALLEDMIASLGAGAVESGFPGVNELLRVWTSALRDVWRGGGGLSADDLLQMTMWFMALQEHVAGRLDRHGREMLAQMPDGIRWLSRPSPALVRVILRKLDLSSASPDMAIDMSTAPRAEGIDDTLLFTTPHASASDDIHDDSHWVDAVDTIDDASFAFGANRALPVEEFILSSSDLIKADDTSSSLKHNDTADAFAIGEAISFDQAGAFNDPGAQAPFRAPATHVTPELLAQLPPEFLAAFPPGALDDLPIDVIEALLLETVEAHEMAAADSSAPLDSPFPDFFGSQDSAESAFVFDSAGFDTTQSEPGHAIGEATSVEIEAFADMDRADAAGATPSIEVPDSDFAFAGTPEAAHLDTQSVASDFEIGFDPHLSNPVANAETLDDDIAAEGSLEMTISEPASAEMPLLGMPETSIAWASSVDARDLSTVAFDAGSFSEHESDESATERAIWIGREELDLTRQAIEEQLIPMAQAWAETPDPDVNAPILEELSYQCQLVVNVMELIGTTTLAQGMESVRVGIEARDPALTPEALATWCSVLLATIEQPDAESAEALAIAAHDLPGIDADWQDALIAELSRVRIGVDPALIAERKTTASLDDIALAPADDVLPSVLDGMLRELPGNASRLGTSVRALANTGAFESIDEARRVAHTLKGDANTVGVHGLGNLTHALEDILIVLAKRPELLSPECADLLTHASDTVEEISDHLLGRGPAPAHLLDTYQHVLDTANALADGADAVPVMPKAAATGVSEDVAAGREAQQTPTTIGAEPETAAARDTMTMQTGMAASGIQSLNVPSALLDDLQRLAGESLVTARQIDRQLDGLAGLHRDQRQEVRYNQELVSRLDDLVALRGAALQSTAQKAGAEMDPLEIDQYNELHVISRQLIEAHADSSEFMRRIERTMLQLADLRNEQEQLNRELQRNILQTRTVPFNQISSRLQRIVRQTAKQVLKPIHLELIGESIPLDAELLERVVEPLAHLLRNAIDHGIETPERRREAGKPEEGRISMRIGLQGDAAIIELQDDGAGLDFDAIRSRAIDAGLLQAHQDADERLLTRLILLPGFSTRSSATEVSGRGIGMDVVNQRIAALRGTMNISSQRGVGMRVSLRLPVTQTLANVIVARGQQQVSAVVAASVERVVSFAAGECTYDAQEGRLWVMLGDERMPALPIESFYGTAADVRMWLNAAGVGLQVLDADGRFTVVLVAGIDEVRSTVVKPISAYLPPIPAVRGITQLGDGGLAPVIDLDVMLQATQERALGLSSVTISNAAPAIRVVVADDSLSVRRSLEQLMQDAGFEVETARDGFEALAAIQARPTHALLVDLEMPRMNGLEVTRNLRTNADTRELPVVMITSRATDKHQAMAEQAGVTRMLGKPFSEDALVTLVRELIAERIALADSDST
jgi:chemotaxis protein histidine kinase CheA